MECCSSDRIENPDEVTKEQIDDLRKQYEFAKQRALETNDINWRIIAQASKATIEQWEIEMQNKQH